jgi:hypothetical protein
MSEFEDTHASAVTGTLTMFDRLIFKGHLTGLHKPGGIGAFLWEQGYPLTEWSRYTQQATATITANAKALAAQAGRPYQYLDHATTRWSGQTKEGYARSIVDQDGVSEGLICVLSIVEPARSFDCKPDPNTHHLEVRPRQRKCVHHYLYVIDPEFGFMHICIQAWLPYTIQIWINGREWLARQLDRAGVAYLRHENALLRIDDLQAASELCERFAHRAWPRVLDAFARRVNPVLDDIVKADFGGYYWVIDQAEVATDVMFKDRAALQQVWPDLVRHASLNMSSADVVGFLGRKLHPSLKAEVITDTKHRPEGWRVKHRLARNWIKTYDKVSVLRVEVTINNPREFRVLRVFIDEQGRRERRWSPMNKGVANMWRYFQVGIQANRRYLDALAAAPLKGKGVAALDALCRSRTKQGRHVSRFNPLSPNDLDLFRAVLAGQHTIVGFRNADLASRLYPHPPATPQEAQRRCARVSRLIAKLRGHGLVAKVPRQHLYRVTEHGYRAMTAALTIHDNEFPDTYLRAA